MFSFPKDAIRAREHVRSSFISYYASLGYVLVPPEPLVPSQDKSLLFTGSTVVALKGFLLSEVPYPGLVIWQPCLRLHNLTKYGNQDWDPYFLSYFHMVSILAHPNRRPQLASEAVGFLEGFGLNPERLRLQSSRSLALEDVEWQQLVGRVETDSRPQSYYSWRYGVPGLVGQGFTVEVETDSDGFQELGNQIRVDLHGKTVGYEFGFGSETLLSRVYSLRGPFESSPVSAVIPFKPTAAHKQLQDLVVTALMIYHVGARPGQTGVEASARRALGLLVNRIAQAGMSAIELRRVISELAELEFGGDSRTVDDLLQDIDSRRLARAEQLDRLKKFVVNQKHLLGQGRFDGNPQTAREHAHQRGRKMYEQLTEEEVGSVVRDVFDH